MNHEGMRVIHRKFGYGDVVEDSPDGTFLVLFDEQNDALHSASCCSAPATVEKYSLEERLCRCFWCDDEDIEDGTLKIINNDNKKEQ